MATTYEPIASQTLSSNSASVTFTSIPGTYTDLILVARGTSTANANLGIRFNSDSGTNYSRTFMFGDGSATSSSRESNVTVANNVFFTTSEAVTVINVMSYSNTSVFKTVISQGAIPSIAVNRVCSLYRSTSAISSLSLTADAGNIAAGSTFSLYGIKAA
jgi:hypothetical protein